MWTYGTPSGACRLRGVDVLRRQRLRREGPGRPPNPRSLVNNSRETHIPPHTCVPCGLTRLSLQSWDTYLRVCLLIWSYKRFCGPGDEKGDRHTATRAPDRRPRQRGGILPVSRNRSFLTGTHGTGGRGL